MASLSQQPAIVMIRRGDEKQEIRLSLVGTTHG
jgi:hypothetical protein